MNKCRTSLKALKSNVSYSGITPQDGIIYWHLDEDHLTPDMNKYKILFALEQAFNFIQPYMNPLFKSTNDKDKAPIVIRFANNGDYHLPFLFENGVLAYAFFPEGESLGMESDIFLNDALNWQEAHTSTGVELLRVLIHEILHALGVPHVDNPEDIMAPWYNPNIPIQITKATSTILEFMYGEKATTGKDLELIKLLTNRDWSRISYKTIVKIAKELGIDTYRKYKYILIREIIRKLNV